MCNWILILPCAASPSVHLQYMVLPIKQTLVWRLSLPLIFENTVKWDYKNVHHFPFSYLKLLLFVWGFFPKLFKIPFCNSTIKKQKAADSRSSCRKRGEFLWDSWSIMSRTSAKSFLCLWTLYHTLPLKFRRKKKKNPFKIISFPHIKSIDYILIMFTHWLFTVCMNRAQRPLLRTVTHCVSFSITDGTKLTLLKSLYI